MTLPHGFGRRNYDVEPPRKCRLGKICYKGSYEKKCKAHKWKDDHDDLYLALQIIGIIAGVITVIVTAVLAVDAAREPVREMIEGYNCAQLAEYIADKNDEYGYAVHRYEWLCVNEQIKEFQG